MKRVFKQKHSPIPFRFQQNTQDFIVEELPVHEQGADKGNYLIAKVQKEELSTMEMIDLLQAALDCHSIGYAGLKDKHATTTQYISMPLAFAKAFEKFKHPRIKVLETFRSRDKLNIGDLKGNHFQIRLKEVSEENAAALQGVLDMIMREGMPNYFGYQRFGFESSNFEKARDVARGEKIMKDTKVHKMMLHAYQSYLFNDWLAERIRLSKEIEKRSCEELLVNHGIAESECEQLKNQPGLLAVLPGDIMLEAATGKWVNVTDLQQIRKPYKEQKLVPTGLLPGSKAWRAKGMAGKLEEAYDDLLVTSVGTRREAIVYPKRIRSEYNADEKVLTLSFSLPKGAYATVQLENLANRDLTPKKV